MLDHRRAGALVPQQPWRADVLAGPWQQALGPTPAVLPETAAAEAGPGGAGRGACGWDGGPGRQATAPCRVRQPRRAGSGSRAVPGQAAAPRLSIVPRNSVMAAAIRGAALRGR